MAETASNMIPLGTKAPDFSLIDPRTNKMVSLQEQRSKLATVIMFLSNHCPYVKHIRAALLAVVEEYQAKGVSFIAIGSNDVEKYPADSPANMKIEAETYGFSFPYLYDENQDVARAYRAACTPDFYIFDADLHCVYRGCLDESTPGNNKASDGSHLRSALEAILAGKKPSPEQKHSLGCNIKWKEALSLS